MTAPPFDATEPSLCAETGKGEWGCEKCMTRGPDGIVGCTRRRQNGRTYEWRQSEKRWIVEPEAK